MAWRFRRTISVAPGIRLNLNKRGPSVRVGPKGVGATVGPRSARVSAGIPGTGIYAYKQVGRTGGHGSSSGSRTEGHGSSSGGEFGPMTVPYTRGEAFPGGWATLGAFMSFFAIVGAASGSAALAGFFVVLAAGCAYAMYRRMVSPAYHCAKILRRAARASGEERGRLLGMARKADPGSVVAMQANALYLLDRDDGASAVAEFQAALELQPNDIELATGLAVAYQVVGNHAAAIALLEPRLSRIDEDDPLDQRILGFLAESLCAIGEPGRGLEVVKRAPLRRHNLDLTLQYCLLTRGRCLLVLGKKDDAKRDFDRLYAIDPGFPELKELMAAAS